MTLSSGLSFGSSGSNFAIHTIALKARLIINILCKKTIDVKMSIATLQLKATKLTLYKTKSADKD